MQGNLPKPSEAHCALEVGHPQELLLFMYPAGVCHQINIIKCLLAWNKYLARKKQAHRLDAYRAWWKHASWDAPWDALP